MELCSEDGMDEKERSHRSPKSVHNSTQPTQQPKTKRQVKARARAHTHTHTYTHIHTHSHTHRHRASFAHSQMNREPAFECRQIQALPSVQQAKKEMGKKGKRKRQSVSSPAHPHTHAHTHTHTHTHTHPHTHTRTRTHTEREKGKVSSSLPAHRRPARSSPA